MAELKPNLTANLAIQSDNLYDANVGSGAGPIKFDSSTLTSDTEKKNEIINYIRLRLGDGIVDVEADQEHFDMGLKQAFHRYRQRSSNAVEESYAFLDIYPETQEYILPQEVIDVKQIYRRGIGSTTGTTASQFEPFATGYINTYMLVAGRVGGMANYELFTQYQEMAMRMFGGFMNFHWNKVSKKLTLVRKIPSMGANPSSEAYETVLLHTYNYKPDVMLLNDPQVYPWIQEYAYAMVMISIGQAREKFASIAGPQGGTALNGTALKQEGFTLQDKLDLEISQYMDGGAPLTWLIG